MSQTFSPPVGKGFRLTSPFSRARTLNGVTRPHSGTDWAPPTPGQKGTIAVAVADATVKDVGFGVLPGHTGLIVVLDHGIVGGDRTLTNYGHLAEAYVKKGQRIKVGQPIGEVGTTGASTAIHLHFGVRFNGRFYDPDAWLRRKGIVTGKTDLVPYTQTASTTPKTSTTSVPEYPSGSPVGVKVLQTRLKNMGYRIVVDGVWGPKTYALVKEYQRSQKKPFTLVADGIWGKKTEAHYDWVGLLQTTLNKWKSSTKKLSVDGHYGANTIAKVLDIQRRNRGGAYKGYPDGVPGKIMCRMLGIPTHP